MAIIQFANGVRVNFNGTPTPKDVEEVAAKLGLNKQTPTPPITTPSGQSTPAPAPMAPDPNARHSMNGTGSSDPSQLINAGNTAANVLGIQKAGQGIATTGRVLSGSINQTGTEEGQMIRDQQAVIGKLQQLRAQGVPQNSLQYQQLLNFLKRNQGNTAVTQAQIDPGTQLSNKEVAGSFGNVALLATAPGLPTGGSSLAGKVAAGAATGYAADVANAANNNQDNIYTPGLGTVVGAGLPIVSKVGGAILKRVVGATTGAGTNVIERAISNPNEVSAAIKEYATTPEAKQSLVDRARSAVNDFLHQRSQEFGQGVSGLKIADGQAISKQTVVDSFSQNLEKFKGQIKNGQVVFNDTALNSTEQKALKDAYNIINGWKDVTPQGFDTLRQRIGNEMSAFKATNNGRDSVVLGAVKKDLTQLMKDKLPGYGDILSTYGKKTDAGRALLADLTTSSKSPTTQLNKVMGIFKKDPSVIKTLETVMGQKEANSFLNEVSGAILSDWMPHQGLGRQIAEGGAGLATAAGTLLHVPGTLPAAAAGAVMSSPKIVGKVAVGTGKLIQKGAGATARRAASIAASKAR